MMKEGEASKRKGKPLDLLIYITTLLLYRSWPKEQESRYKRATPPSTVEGFELLFRIACNLCWFTIHMLLVFTGETVNPLKAWNASGNASPGKGPTPRPPYLR